MRKTWIIIASIIGIITIAVIYLVATRPAQESLTSSATDSPAATETTAPPAADSSDQTPAQEAIATETPGKYTDYSADAIASTEGRKIIFFYAPWCPQCRALEKSILANTIPSDVTIFKTDYDSSTDLRLKYGVTIQTTLVEVDDNGNAVNKYVAYNTPSLQAVIEAMGL